MGGIGKEITLCFLKVLVDGDIAQGIGNTLPFFSKPVGCKAGGTDKIISFFDLHFDDIVFSFDGLMEEFTEGGKNRDIEQRGIFLVFIMEDFSYIVIDQDNIHLFIDDEKSLVHGIKNESQFFLFLGQGMNLFDNQFLRLVDLVGQGFDFDILGHLFILRDNL